MFMSEVTYILNSLAIPIISVRSSVRLNKLVDCDHTVRPIETVLDSLECSHFIVSD